MHSARGRETARSYPAASPVGPPLFVGPAGLAQDREVVATQAMHNEGAKKSRRLVRYDPPPGLGRMYHDVQLMCRAEKRNDPRTKELVAVLRKTLTEACSLPI